MNEGPASFQAGQKSGTNFHNGVLRLDPDPACLGNWTRQTDGVPSSRSEHAKCKWIHLNPGSC